MNIIEFLKGQADCIAGLAHNGGSESYDAGYSYQYQLEQIRSANHAS